jgi:hypothetical protein
VSVSYVQIWFLQKNIHFIPLTRSVFFMSLSGVVSQQSGHSHIRSCALSNNHLKVCMLIVPVSTWLGTVPLNVLCLPSPRLTPRSFSQSDDVWVVLKCQRFLSVGDIYDSVFFTSNKHTYQCYYPFLQCNELIDLFCADLTSRVKSK